MLAAVLATPGCANGGVTPAWPGSDPRPEYGSGAPAPDGLDYTRAIQCGGLMWALQATAYRTRESEPLLSVAGLYREWAQLRAREAGNDQMLALRDMAASRDDFLRQAGKGSGKQMSAAINAAYPGDVNACRSAAEAADFDIVIVGG